jgi:hydrogenase/urease accessory protein HupE
MNNYIGGTALLALLATSAAHAHEGYHPPGLTASLWHLLSQPDHWLGLSLVVAVAVAAGAIRRRRTGSGKEARTQTIRSR